MSNQINTKNKIMKVASRLLGVGAPAVTLEVARTLCTLNGHAFSRRLGVGGIRLVGDLSISRAAFLSWMLRQETSTTVWGSWRRVVAGKVVCVYYGGELRFLQPLAAVKERLDFLLLPFKDAPVAAAIAAADWKLLPTAAEPGGMVQVKTGSSYFGSGAYSANAQWGGSVSVLERKDWNNGFASGEEITLRLDAPGAWVAASAGDAIGGHRQLDSRLLFIPEDV